MSLEAWPTLDPAGQRVLLDALLERLPPWLELVEAASQPRFRDAGSGEGWRLFTGGEATLGLTAERLAAIEALQERHPLVTFDPTVYLPSCTVLLSPFLMMEAPVSSGGEPRFFLSAVNDEEGQAWLARHGARLPTEAEWEFAWWATRQAGANWAPATSELCADLWRPDLRPTRAAREEEVHVVRTSSDRPDAPESLLPSRQPSSLGRMHTLRAVLDVPPL